MTIVLESFVLRHQLLVQSSPLPLLAGTKRFQIILEVGRAIAGRFRRRTKCGRNANYTGFLAFQ